MRAPPGGQRGPHPADETTRTMPGWKCRRAKPEMREKGRGGRGDTPPSSSPPSFLLSLYLSPSSDFPLSLPSPSPWSGTRRGSRFSDDRRPPAEINLKRNICWQRCRRDFRSVPDESVLFFFLPFHRRTMKRVFARRPFKRNHPCRERNLKMK